MQLPRIAATLILLGIALDSAALTIGRPQGPVWIGKPLDVVIPITLDSSEPGDSLCLEAEVLQGDNRIPDRRITLSVDPGPSPGTPRVRIRSTVAIDEPVVTLNLRAGCATKSIRNYVLLSDVQVGPSLPAVAASGASGEPQRAPVPASRPAAPSSAESGGGSPGFGAPAGTATRPRAASSSVASTGDADTAPRQTPARPRRPAVETVTPRPAPAPRPRRAAPVAAAPKPAPAPTPATAPKPATQGGSRLQVDALEPVPAAQVQLKTASQLSLPAVEDPARRAAAAAQWSAANPDPDAAARESQRMKELEATLATLRQQTAQNQRMLLEMQSQLAEARESRYRNPLVYSLIALLLVALIVMLFLWRMARRSAEAAWWRDAAAARGPGAEPGPTDEDLFKGSPALRDSSVVGFAGSPGMEPAVDSGFNEPDEVLPLRAAADSTPVRPVNTEELFDVQQQSDFFLSLGQHDQAIAVLREHIVANPGTSALAYLDLLRIFHSLERREDYALLAEEFERAFNATVPSFDEFNESAGKGLEHYRSALARIESQWPAPGTLALIEEMVFRAPGASEEEAFDLAAYQELLLLYSVAKEVIDPDRAPPAPVTPQSFVDTISHDQAVTAPAPLGPEEPPEAIQDGPQLAPSIYGAIDDSLGHETVMSEPTSTPSKRPTPPAQVDVDLAQFDSTAYETMPAALEPAKAAPAPADPHVIDFELFDPETEADIAPRPTKR